MISNARNTIKLNVNERIVCVSVIGAIILMLFLSIGWFVKGRIKVSGLKTSKEEELTCVNDDNMDHNTNNNNENEDNDDGNKNTLEDSIETMCADV